jgi:mono/diheme cytochrome c family protein
MPRTRNVAARVSPRPLQRGLFRFILRAGAAVLLAAVSHAALAPAGEIEFNRDIRPILSDRCFACHGPDATKRQADLRLDVEQSAKESVIVAGKPHESEVVARITAADADTRMPPLDSGKTLTSAEIELIKRWIAAGAEYQPFWAYVKPRRHPLPSIADPTWPNNWIDSFVLNRLGAEGLSPSPDADRVTLIRRLSFDLVGLPPTPAEVDAFVSDNDPGAYERLVDRQLESPHFGERMAMYWLDLVRYADTVGYHGDQDQSISPYRDYVIDAFNENLPFDRFTREQLAGDLVADSGTEQTIASGYNRLLQTSHEGGIQPKEYRAIYAADRVRNLSAVWLGATMGCCQCHDHKYDPYTSKDFYAMAAFFADVDDERHFTDGGDTLPTKRLPELDVPTEQQRRHLDALASEVCRLEAQRKDAADTISADKDAADKDAAETDATKALDEQLAKLKRQQEDVRKTVRRTMITVALGTPRTTRLLPRGNWLDESGEIVQPAIPEFLGVLNCQGRRATRLDLADWLVSADDGGAGLLTARVMANRFWYLCFGNGLAGVLDDFGAQGEAPVHPELLDNLAVEFVESGWDVKHMLKLIVMSRAYRQSSAESPALRERDPLNRLYARQSRFRLPAEMVRDTALAASGLLVDRQGGASVKPYQPAGYYRHLNFPTRIYKHDTDERQWRRGVYVHWQRQYLHPMLKAFDAPSREECTARRPRSNTPLAALVLLNDPTFVEAARVFAERALAEGGDSFDARLDFIFRRALSRTADKTERALLADLLDEGRKQFHDSPQAAKELIGVGQEKASADVDLVELAAWTGVARAVFNMSETITRN